MQIVTLLQIASLLGSLALTLIACYPAIDFLSSGWCTKKDDIMSSFSPKAKKLYLTYYFNIDSNNPDIDFNEIYNNRYGRRNYCLPLFLFSVCLIVLMYFFVQTALSNILINEFQFKKGNGTTYYDFMANLPGIAVAALAGAYLWIVSDLVAQMRRSDFRPSYIILATLRLVSSIPIGYATASFADADFAPFVAFATSAFPIDQVRIIMRRLTGDKLGITISEDDGKDRVKKLNGVDLLTSDAFQDVGITTISQLAYYDPVKLAIKTGFNFDYIGDVVGQALAWDYLGERLDLIRPLGLRTAVEFKFLLKQANADEPGEKKQAIAAIEAAASAVSMQKDVFMNVCWHIANDPVTDFLSVVWTEG